jgi:hypothetical protein
MCKAGGEGKETKKTNMHYNNNLVRQLVCVLLLSLALFAPVQAQQEDDIAVHIAPLDSPLLGKRNLTKFCNLRSIFY